MIAKIHELLTSTPPDYLKANLNELYVAANNSDIADGWDKSDRTRFAESVVNIIYILETLEND